jgi:bla regulator protein BlaR1
MIADYLVSAVGNHLWQSTVFAGAVALLALTLRKNRASIRSALWLAASLKFLIPFSLLIRLGSRFQLPAPAPSASPNLSVAVGQIAQITQPFAPVPSGAVTLAPHPTVLPMLLLAIWMCGSLAVVFSWWRRWRRVRLAVRAAAPLNLQAGVPVLSSPELLEPGVFGLFRPVLVLPEGITDRLEPRSLQAIVAHELCHIRRHDNLASAVHMAVEAMFWFHPLVWWIGARLVEERERACDEEVLRQGSQPEVYAESILKICRLYLESPLACVSGISGSDLKQRIRRIMTQGLASRLSFGRKLLLFAAGMTAVAGPIVFGLMNASQSRAQNAPSATFEVASVKPAKAGSPGMFIRNDPNGRFSANNIPLAFLIQFAYRLKESQLTGGPSWINTERYDIEAKPDDATVAALQSANPDKRFEIMMPMLQSMLEERFKLTVHHDKKELQVYSLVVAKNGPKMHASDPAPTDPAASVPLGPGHGNIRMGRGQLDVDSQPLSQVVDVLSHILGRVVVDNTGLTGKYDFNLKWTPGDEEQAFKQLGPGPDGRPAPPPPDSSGPTIFTALQEQLGLKLESQKSSVDTLVIDHVEKPSEN